MKPDKLTAYQLFEMNHRYVVPLFQRPYVWTREAQWEPLWADITFKADQIIDRDEDDDIGAHFLGAAVVNQIKTFGRQVPTYEIIDGQQRLTTLQMLLFAFRSFLKQIQHPDEGLEHDLTKLTLNGGTRASELEKYKVWPTTADRATFEAIFASASPEDLDKKREGNPIGSPMLADAYRFFYDSISEYVRFGENDDEVESPEYDVASEMAYSRINALMETLQRHLEIVVIELEKGDDPQIIFETLNARGVPLLPSDLIRNFVFLEASGSGEDIERLYNEYWLPYDDYKTGQAAFWKEEEGQGRFKRPRIDLFMFYYLTLKTGQEIRITHIFQEFRHWWHRTRQKGKRVEEYLQDIKKYARIFQKLVTAEGHSRLGVFMHRLRAMETTTVYPLLLYLYGEHGSVPEADLLGILTDLESYLVRRMLCGLSARSYGRNFLIVLRDLQREGQVNQLAFREILTGFEGDAGRWPGDEDLRNNWLQAPMYRRLSRGRLRMVLEAVDLQLETSKQERVHIEGDLSIEHIYPQSPDPQVWAPLENPVLVHSIGNLTLLTQELNSSVSNGPFVLKRPEIAKQSKLRMNVYFQELTGKEAWGQEGILARGERLFEVARAVWPAPPHQPPTRLSAGKQRTVETLCVAADERGIGPAFRQLVDVALRNGLHLRTTTNSITVCPIQNKNFALYSMWAKPRRADRVRTYLAGETFTRFYPVTVEQVAEHLGESGWRHMTMDEVALFSHGLDTILGRTGQ